MRNIPKFRSDKDKLAWLASICGAEINRAEGGDSDELQANREQALKYYFCKPRGDEVVDRSKVISADVADMVNATLAMLVPMLSTDCVVEFEPVSEDDEDQAKAESDVVNDIVQERNNGFIEVQEAVKDALLLKNGVMKVEVDEQVDVQRFDAPTGEDANAQIAMWALSAAPNQTRVVKNGKLIETTTTRTFVVRSVPVENVGYQAGYAGDLDKIRFFYERLPSITPSDLHDMGIPSDLIDKAQASTEAKSGPARARNVKSDESYAETRDQQPLDVYACYIRVDLDGDGYSERYKVLVASKTLGLSYEEHDLLPYSIGSPFLNPHRITGESLFDHMKVTQDAKTALRRQLLDNVTLINNGRVIYDPSRTSEEDILNAKAGGGIRSRDPANAVIPVVIPDVTMGILAALNYEDQARTERGGASLDLISADAQMIGQTAHGIERQYASREALASMMAKNLSETLVRRLYLLVHEYLRRYANEPFMVQINGKYQQVDPSQWKKRSRVNIKTGLSPNQRAHIQQTLMMHMQLSAQAMAQGMDGVLASAETIHRTNVDWLRMAGIDNPERLNVNPMSEAAQQAVQAKQQAQQAQQEAMQAQVQQMVQIEMQKIQADMQKHQGDLQFKYYDANLDAELEEAKIAGQGTIDLELQRMKNAGKDQTGSRQIAASATGDSK